MISCALFGLFFCLLIVFVIGLRADGNPCEDDEDNLE